MKTFVINGNEVKAKGFDFNALVDFDSYGVSIQDMSDKPLTFIRAYVAYCMGVSLEEAGQNINDHIINGGKFDDVFKVVNEALEESGFFRALQDEPKEIQTTTTTSKRKTKQ